MTEQSNRVTQFCPDAIILRLNTRDRVHLMHEGNWMHENCFMSHVHSAAVFLWGLHQWKLGADMTQRLSLSCTLKTRLRVHAKLFLRGRHKFSDLLLHSLAQLPRNGSCNCKAVAGSEGSRWREISVALLDSQTLKRSQSVSRLVDH